MTDITEMIAVIEAYISHRTGQQIRINQESAWVRGDLTIQAYNIATKWFQDNDGRISFVS
jgi:hypothetical protein